VSVRAVRKVEEFATVAAGGSEGLLRFSPLDFCRFLDYALGSRREADGWIQDGIEFGYFQEAQCRRAFWFGERCFTATLRLMHSQERDAEHPSVNAGFAQN
jgi:hypothetical protein